jgi:hypothetical protein
MPSHATVEFSAVAHVELIPGAKGAASSLENFCAIERVKKDIIVTTKWYHEEAMSE